MTYAGIVLALLASALLLLQAQAATGYGTSSISLANSSVSLPPGGSAAVGYTVNLPSGNTWGTTLNVVNAAQLSAQGITVVASNPSGNPPYSGRLTIPAAASAKAGSYSVVLNVTGDDPSTSNATLTIDLAAGATTTAVSQSYGPHGLLLYALIAEIVVVLIGAGVAMTRKKAPTSRLILLGVALILIGTGVWLYGDYSGSLAAYIWSGVALIAIGVIVWLIGDHKGHLI